MLTIIIAATLWTASHLRTQLESTAVQDLRQTNRLALSMIEAYDRSLCNDIDRSGRIFAGNFDKQLELVEGGERPLLVQRGTPISDRLEIVDAFTAKARTVATIFVRQGNDFLRSATSLNKEDGSRATGTLLAADHPARQAILDGKPYTGKASFFGRDYMAHYTLALDASGKVVGVFFVGLEFTKGLKALKEKLLAINEQSIASQTIAQGVEQIARMAEAKLGCASDDGVGTGAARQGCAARSDARSFSRRVIGAVALKSAAHLPLTNSRAVNNPADAADCQRQAAGGTVQGTGDARPRSLRLRRRRAVAGGPGPKQKLRASLGIDGTA